MTRRGRRRLVMLIILVVVVGGASAGGYALLKWRRAQAIVDARAAGLEAFSDGRHSEVLEVLGPHIRKFDQDAEVVRTLARSRRLVEMADGGHLRGAAALYRRAADLDDEDLESRLALLELLPKMGLLAELVIASEEVLEIDPENLAGREAQVQAFAAMGRWEDAVELSGELIEDYPGDARWRQLQVGAAYSAGLNETEVLALVDNWPSTEAVRALDLSVKGAILLQAGNAEAANRLLEEAAEVGTSNPEALRDVAGILADAGRNDLAFQIFERYIDRNTLDRASAEVVADWAMRLGEREWLATLSDSWELPDIARAIVASRLAVFSMMVDSGQFASASELVEDLLADAPESMPDLKAFQACLEIVASGDDGDVREFIAGIDRQSLYQVTLAVLVCEQFDCGQLEDLLTWSESLSPSILSGAAAVESLRRRGRSIDALRRAVDLAERFPHRREPVLLVASLWATIATVPADLELKLYALTDGGTPFDLISRIRTEVGPIPGMTIPYIRSAIRIGAWAEVDEAIEDLIASGDVAIGELVEVHGLVSGSRPETAEFIVRSLLSMAPEDPRIVALTWGAAKSSGAVDVATRRSQLKLESGDAVEREIAWDVFLRGLGELGSKDFLGIAREAFGANSDSARVLEVIVGDARVWEDEAFVRSVIDRYAELVGDSAGVDILEARWAAESSGADVDLFDQALARLDRRYVSGDRSLPVGMAMLSMLLSREDGSSAAIIRLARQILQDHPEAVELYPVAISVMQDAGMLEEAEEMLQEFESVDAAGIASARQRTIQSLRTGNFVDLASTMSGIVDATDEIEDVYRLALAKKAMGSIRDAEVLFQQVLTEGDGELKEASARALAGLLNELGRSGELADVLLPHADTLPGGLVEALVLGASANRGDDQAVDRLGQLVAEYPELLDGWVLLVRTLIDRQRMADAASAALEGLGYHPQSRALARSLIGAALVEPSLLARFAASNLEGNSVVKACLALLVESLNGTSRLQPDSGQVAKSRDLCGRFPDELISWSTAMAIHEAAGQLAECRALAMSASRRFPSSPEPVEWRVRIAALLGETDSAISDCRTWRTLAFPDVRRVDEMRAALEVSRGNGAVALRVLEPHMDVIVENQDSRPGPYRALLAAMLMTGDVRRARQMEGSRFASDASSRATWAKLSTMSDYRSGLEAMSLLESATPSDMVSRAILIGQWLDFHRRHPDGDALSRARQLLPSDVASPRDFQSRMELLARASIARIDGAAAVQRAMLEAVIESFQSAETKSLDQMTPRERDEHLVEIQPLIMAKNNLAMSLLEQQQDLDRAEDLVASCLELLPLQPSLRDSHARILLAAGRASEAERSVAIAVRQAAADPAVMATAAEVLAATGRVEQARIALQRVRDGLNAELWPDRELEARVEQVSQLVSGSS